MFRINRSFLALTIIGSFILFANVLYAWTGAPGTSPAAGNSAFPLNVSATDQTKTGALTVGKLSVYGEIVDTLQSSPGQFRMVAGNYGTFWRNDGGNTYLLLTNSGDQYGSWRSLWPFYVDDNNGAVHINTQLCLKGVCRSSWPPTYHASGVNLYQNGGTYQIGTSCSGCTYLGSLVVQ